MCAQYNVDNILWWGVIKTEIFQKGVCHPLHTHLEIFQLKKCGLYTGE